ncbi:hypothetical protein E2L92_21995 [Salmonella enterica subsp. enterica serovar Ibadan]|nr:hypothetical protein [Salmonella enterica subsp. enterica serovar Ibadan]ECF3282125.1 hypothetical protein [Salmonella enterica subsp. enterica serovar Ibadan]
MLPIETISDDAGFTIACKNSWHDVTRILTYMIKTKKEQVFNKGLDTRKREKLVREVEHLEEIITTVQNEVSSLSPEL